MTEADMKRAITQLIEAAHDKATSAYEFEEFCKYDDVCNLAWQMLEILK